MTRLPMPSAPSYTSRRRKKSEFKWSRSGKLASIWNRDPIRSPSGKCVGRSRRLEYVIRVRLVLQNRTDSRASQRHEDFCNEPSKLYRMENVDNSRVQSSRAHCGKPYLGQGEDEELKNKGSPELVR